MILCILIIGIVISGGTTLAQGKGSIDIKVNDKLPASCLIYKDTLIEKIESSEQLNEADHLAILLAIMAVESNCDSTNHPDLFGIVKDTAGNVPESITAISIAEGVAYFDSIIVKMGELAEQDIDFAIQSYDYEVGFLDFIKGKEPPPSKYSDELSLEYFKILNNPLKDSEYVKKVHAYLEVTDPIVIEGGALTTVPLVSNNIRFLQPYGFYADGSGAHYGIDLTAGYGAIVVSSADGVVVMVHGGSCPDGSGLYSSCGGGYGNGVTIKHNDQLYTRYGHMQPNSVIVTVGQIVKAGDKLGLEGDSGSSTASHLHFEVRVADGFNKPDTRNPEDYIKIPFTNR